MPRKVNYGVDFDEYDVWDLDDYHDEDDDEQQQQHQPYGDEDDYEEEKPKLKDAVSKSGVWRCSICTFDNNELLPACEVCGVFRDRLVVSSNGSKETVDDLSKDRGASILAKSLFAPFPHSTPQINAMFQQQNDGFASKDASNSNKTGNILGKKYDFSKELTLSYHKYNTNIVPFKFDSLSPDDLVSRGKKKFSTTSKGNLKESDSGVLSNYADKKDKAKISPSVNGLEISASQKQKFGPRTAENHPSFTTEDDLETMRNSFKETNVNDDSARKYIDIRKTASCSKYVPEAWMLSDEEGTPSQLNIAIVGHVDSGKSTLTGRLLNLLGRISQKEMHKYEKDAKSMGKSSFAYAWALDESAEERERGITMTVAVAYFYSKKYHVVVLDSPGHRDFVPNMISGATQADAAVLVVDASIGSFESGMDGNGNGGQTREHAQLIRSFGVDQIIVAINKMDTVKYSKERFDSIKLQLGTFLRTCGFKDSLLTWVPISAMENQNLVTVASDNRLSSWYRGPYLLDAIDSLQPPARDVSKPLVMPICDVVKSHSLGQVAAAASGKLETGALRCGSKVLLMPSGDLATVRSLERDSKACKIARAGDNVSVCLQGIDGSGLMAGGVLCHPDYPPAVASHLELKVILLDAAGPILVGSQMELHVHHAKEAARVVRILSLLDPKSGKVSKRAPRCLTAKQSAMIEVTLDGAVCVEEFSKCRALGRVFLRASGKTSAVGIVTRII